jgi:hypothetical protein
MQELNLCRREIDTLHKQAREALIEKLRQGDPIEPGRLSVRLKGYESRQLAAKALEGALNREEIEHLQGLVEPKVHLRVVIEELA